MLDMVNEANWNSLEWEFVREGVERKAFSGQGATMAMNRLMPGHEPRPHSHIHEQLVYIMEGHIDFHIEDKVHHLGPGSLLVVPSDKMHWGEVVGDVPVINLDVFTPRRSEYA